MDADSTPVRLLDDPRVHRHLGWDRARPPVAEIASGEVIECELADCFDGQLGADARGVDLASVDLARANPLTGPVRVDGARAGDALALEVLDVDVASVGWTAIIPGFGLLADDFGEPHVVVSGVDATSVAFGRIALLPLAPFLGTVGVVPAEEGIHGVIPPRVVGGNLDCRDVRPGARLVLPIAVDGAGLSLGDAHARQGDGEVCGTAVECAARARLRVHLEPGGAAVAPRVEVPPGAVHPEAVRHTDWREVTLGIGSDLRAAAREATRRMIERLGVVHAIAPADAYALCSVAGNLRIMEVVNAPNWVVGMDLSLSDA